jgi:hypothetical protein
VDHLSDALPAARLLLLAAAAAAAGCSAAPPAPPPFQAPRAFTYVTHFAGSPLAGPGAATAAATATATEAAAGAPAVDPSTALQVEVALLALDALPLDDLDPIAVHARVRLAPDAKAPLAATPRLLAGARAGSIPDRATYLRRLERREKAHAAPLDDLRGALPRGVTAAFEAVRDAGPPASSGERARERLAVLVHRVDADVVEVAVEVEGKAAREGGGLERELAVLERRPLGGGGALALIVPSPFSGEAARALVAAVAVGPPPPPGSPDAAAHREATGACAADLARAAALGAARAAAPPPAPARAGPPPDLAAARSGLLDGRRQRAVLVGLAHACGARLAEDVALEEDDALVAEVAGAVRAALVAKPVADDDPAVRWIVERAATERVLPHLAPDAPPRPLDSILARRAGALGRARAALAAALEAATDAEDFARRLEAGNRALLEDPDPAVRARASEWLEAPGQSPDPAARRSAPGGTP